MRRGAFPAAMALAAVAAAACGDGPPSSPHATAGTVPDAAREVLLRMLERQAGAGTRDSIRARMRVSVTPSAAVPALLYEWAAYTPASRETTYRAVAASAGGRPTPLRRPHEWSATIWPVGWSPATPRQAVTACAEVARAVGAHPREDDVIFDATMSGRWRAIDSAAARRLHPPLAIRHEYGRWEAVLWLGEPGITSRYRCLFAPRTGRRGPLAEFDRTDSIVGAGPIVEP